MTDDQLKQIFTNDTLTVSIPFCRHDISSGAFHSYPQCKNLRFTTTRNYLLAPLFTLHDKQPVCMMTEISGIVNVSDSHELSISSGNIQSLVTSALRYGGQNYTNFKENKSVLFLSLFISTPEIKKFNLDSNYEPVTNSALLQLFGNNLKNNSLLRTENAKLFTSIYRHKEKEIYVKVTNYYNELIPDFNSDALSILSGTYFASVEEHLFLATYPILSSAFKAELSKHELDLFKIACNPFNFNTLTIKNKLKEIFTGNDYITKLKQLQEDKFRQTLELQERRRYEEIIQQANESINSYVRRVQETEVTLLNAQKDLCYLEHNPAKTNEILDYINQHKYILNYNLNGSNIFFNIRVPLTQFDTELAETLADNLEHNDYVDSNVTEMKKLFEYLFVKCKGIMYVGGMFQIDIVNWNWNNRSFQGDFNSTDRLNYLKDNKMAYNFHLENYGCAGTYKSQISSALNKRDLIAAIECIMAPFKCWNLADGAVFHSAIGGQLQQIMADNIECIEYNDKMYNIKDYIAACEKETKKEVPKSTISGILKKKKDSDEVAQAEPEGGIRL